jgi:hypothetical protein
MRFHLSWALVQLLLLTGCQSPGDSPQTASCPSSPRSGLANHPTNAAPVAVVGNQRGELSISFRLLAYVHGKSPGERKLYTSPDQYHQAWGIDPASALHLNGFLFEVASPRRFRGKLLAVHWNCIGPPRADGLELFQFDETYRLLVPAEWLDSRDFELCGDAFRHRTIETP